MEQMRDIVVLLPGILGSVLQKDNREVWNLSGKAVASAIWNLGANIQDLAITGEQGDAPDFDDGVTATKLLSDTHLIPWFWKIDGYTFVTDTLRAKFDLRAGENYFEFAYDWRRDNRVAALRLRDESHVWLANWRAKTGNPNPKLVLVGHSMGGIVARYFLEVLEGWRNTRKLITFGTPYQGSLNALSYVANRLKKKVGFVELINLSEMLRSFTSVYQLLPTFKCFETNKDYLRLNDPSVTIPNLDKARVTAAFEFHQEIKDAVERNRRNEEYARNGYKTHPFVGLYQPTAQSAQLVKGKIEVMSELGGKDTDGDGTVPSISATPSEWSEADLDAAVYAAEQHASLQNFNPILVQIARLFTNQNIDFSGFRGLTSRIGMMIDDAFETDEPILVKARSEAFDQLTGIIKNVETGETVRLGDFKMSEDGWQSAEFRPLTAGTYRMTVAEKKAGAAPVTDVFLVLPGSNSLKLS